MKKGHSRRPQSPESPSSAGSDDRGAVPPSMESIDAAIAMSRRVVKESLDLNARSPRGKYDLPRDSRRTGRDSETLLTDANVETFAHPKDSSDLLDRLKSEEIMKRYYEKELLALRTKVRSYESQATETQSLRLHLNEAKAAIVAAEKKQQEMSALGAAKDKTFTAKLMEMEEIVRSLNHELRRKNKEIGKMYAVVAKAEERESELLRSCSQSQQSLSDQAAKHQLEKKLLEDEHSDLKADIQILEKQLKDKSLATEKAVSEIASLEVRLKAAERTVENLTGQIETLQATHSDTVTKLKQSLSDSETARMRLSHQLQDLTDLRSHALDSSGHISHLETKLQDLESAHKQQLTLNLKLQEDVKRLQLENGDLRKAREEGMRIAKEEVNQQTAKFAQKIEDLEFQFQKHITKTSQDMRYFSASEDEQSPINRKRNTRSSASLKAPRRQKV